jgi:hypothetical protein
VLVPAVVILFTATVAAAPLLLPQTSQPPRDAVRRPPSAGTARIRGRVIASDTGSPVRRATVVLSLVPPPPPPRARGTADGSTDQVTSAPPSAPGRSTGPGFSEPPLRATTNAEGGFEFAGLPSGTYRLSAVPAPHSSQYLSMAYGAGKPAGQFWPEPGSTIDLKDGQSFDKAVIALPRGGVLTGRVTDENGDPLARVQVYTLSFPPGWSRPQRTGSGGFTDDLGQFRLFGLQSGEYLAVADPRGNLYGGPGGPPMTEEDRLGFVPTYYPGTLDEGSAQRLRVRAGAETPPVEIRVIQARLFRVAGALLDSQGRPVPQASGQLIRRGPSSNASMGFITFTDAKGQFELRSIPSGDYRLLFRPQELSRMGGAPPAELHETASVPITIAGADVDNMLVTTNPGVSLTGEIVLAQGNAPSGAAPARVSATTSNYDDAAGVPTPQPVTVGPDSTFTLKGLMGEYTLRASMPGQFMKSVSLNGEDITDTLREFKPTDHPVITMTSRVGTVEGNVANGSDVDLSNAAIILFSEDKASWRLTSVRTRRAIVDANGHYRVTGVLPGDYYVAAIPRERLNLIGGAEAEFFEQLTKEGTAVVIGEDEQRKLDVRVLDTTGKQ